MKNKAFFFGDCEGFRQNREAASVRDHPHAGAAAGHPVRRRPQSADGSHLPRGHADPDDAFARKVLNGIAGPDHAGTANNYASCSSSRTTTTSAAARSTTSTAARCRSSAASATARSDNFDQPPIPLPSGGAGNGFTYVNNKQFATGFTWARSGTSLSRSASAGRDGPARTRPRSARRARRTAYGITGLPTDPRVAGGLPTQLITGYADLGRQATNPQWQYPTVFNPKLNYTWIAARTR